MIAAQEPATQTAAAYAAADIRVVAPGVVYNAGLLDLAAAYTKQTGRNPGWKPVPHAAEYNEYMMYFSM
jgi:hypothetical protein